MQPADRPYWKRTAATAIAALVIACAPVLAQTESAAPPPTAEPTVAEAPSVDALKRILQRSDDAAAVAAALADLTARAAADSEAAYVLGNLYFNGAKSVPRDYAKAEPLMQTAAAAGDPLALFKLGEIYRRGEGFDSALAIDYYRQAADLGDAAAAYRLGEYYRTGAGGIAEDRALALQYYQRAEQAGDTGSLIRLGDIYRSGADLDLDPALAVDYYKRAAAAENATALVRLGDIYRTGIAGVAPDPAAAIDYYQQAIAAGNTAVTMKLADGYLDGSLGGSPAQGTELLQQAIAEGIPGAAVALARAYLAGETMPQNTAAALDVLDTAVAAGDAEAGRVLIRLYVDGRDGLPRNLRAARATLDALAPALDAPALAFETLILDIAQRPVASSYPALLANFVQLSSQGKRTALARAYGLDRNAYVYLFQERLAELGYYQGNPNGLLTSTTISAFNRACADLEIVDDCRTGPLSYSARRSSQRAFF
jgi:TPR repeat protein